VAEKHGPSSLPGYGWIVVVLAIVLGVAQGRKTDDRKADTAPTSTVATGPAPGQAVPESALAFLKSREGPVSGPAPDPFTPKTRVLILTLPDPVDSQLGYWYDQSLDALTMAMSDHPDRYILADWWFPWTVPGGDKSKQPVLRSGTSGTDPGVMIYQKHDDPTTRKVVLVVGENPLSGLNVPALNSALDLAAQCPRDADGRVPLIGPSFTGSQVSLGQALLRRDRNFKSKSVPVRCISGSALGLKDWKELWTGPEGQHEVKQLEDLCGPIQSTQAQLETLRHVAMHYLSQPGRTDPSENPNHSPKERVAYVVEANSGFGTTATGLVTGEQELFFRFPMHIARLAALQSQEARARDQRLGLSRPGSELLLATDATRTGGDVIPSADEARTALINQRLLSDYWAQIRRERIRYVCVIATDKRDVLFLLDQLKDACPDARPVVLTADLHYVHPDYQRFMRGALVVGTYPLFQPVQRWQALPGERRRLPFPSGAAEGLYNAALAALHSPEQMVDYRPPYGAQGTSPPVWVTTVGEHSEFVPLAYFTGYDRQHQVAGPTDLSDADPPDTPFGRTFFYLVTFVVFAILYAVQSVWRVDRSTTAALRTADERVWVPGLRAQYVTIAGIGGVCAILPLVLAFGSAHTLEWRGWVGFGVALVIFLFVLGGTGRYVYKQARLSASDGAQVPKYAILAPWQIVAFAVLVWGATVGWVLADHARLPDSARWLFAERAATLSSGCSPVVPATVLALGLLGLGLLGLQHVRLMSEFKVTAPYPRWELRPGNVARQDFDAVTRIHAAVDEIDARFHNLVGVFADPGARSGMRWIRPLVWVAALCFAGALIRRAVLGEGGDTVREPILYGCGVALAGFAVLASVILLCMVWRREGSVPVSRPRATGSLLIVISGAACAVGLLRAQLTWESRAWNCLFGTGCVTLAFLTLLSGYRLYNLWKLVERITLAMAAIPMVAAFDRFPTKVSQVFGAYLLTPRRRTLDLALPLHLLDHLRALATTPTPTAPAPSGSSGPAAPAPTVDPQMEQLKKAVTRTCADPDPTEEVLPGNRASELCAVAADLVPVLAPGWEQRDLPEAFGTVSAEPGKESTLPRDWRGIAEQFVAIMAVIFLAQYFARMRCLAYMTVVTAAALLLAVTAYQFDPEVFLMYTAVAFAAAVIVLLVWLLFTINCNELVSRATHSTPNKFQLDAAFVQNLVVFVLPLTAVVVTQLAGRMRSVIEPVLGWIR
jgi:hypothetical protein